MRLTWVNTPLPRRRETQIERLTCALNTRLGSHEMIRNTPAIRRTRAAASPPPGAMFSIAQLARAAGEPAHVVRYYCRVGLLEPRLRGSNGYRRFDAQSLRHLTFIRRAQGLGFSLAEVGEILRHAKAGRSPCPTVRDILARRVPEVGGQVEALLALHDRLKRALVRWRRLPDRVPTGDAVCALIESEPPAPASRNSTR